MCKKKNYKSSNPRIDKCMINLIDILQARGIKTIACCCGHQKYPMSIVIKQGWEINPYYVDLMSNTVIRKKRKFYKRDKQGYYYIPETLKGGK